MHSAPEIEADDMISKSLDSTSATTIIMTKLLMLFLAALLIAACSESDPAELQADSETAQVERSGTAYAPVEMDEGDARLSLDEIQKDLDIPVLSQPWSGDLDGMIERRVIRVLTVYGLGRYFIDSGQEKGVTFELFRKFEDEINRREGKKHIRIHVVFIPVARDELISGLLSGRGDVAAAGLTITPEREGLIDFTVPMSKELSEVLVTGPSAPSVSSIKDLAGRDVYVRASSSYRSSLDALNRRLREEGLEEIRIQDISEMLEDEDILELVNSGALEWAVVDDYKARIWSDVFEKLVVRDDIVFRTGGQIGFAIRKDSPQLMSALNEFAKTHRQGTLQGNMLINRYLRDFDWTKNALGADDYRRFQEVVEIFEKYGNQYGVDYLIVAAQGYQESRLIQSARSGAGAVGIMQLLPSTAADPNVGIPDITNADANIHAGVRYLDFIRKRYFNDPEMDEMNSTLFALASYNAGPARIAKLRTKAGQQGYNPDIWFDNVEIIAAQEIGRETVQYVANIVKYYVVYRLSIVRYLQREEERQSAGIERDG
jgi:membrane-bound lytic murein transglycosylase MltF